MILLGISDMPVYAFWIPIILAVVGFILFVTILYALGMLFYKLILLIRERSKNNPPE
jgi:hypothetical protein